jgi:transglutaminase-like putative cysteine protease
VFFHVRHETLYRYSVPVQLAMHTLRLSPRFPNAHTLQVDPAPASRTDRIDPFGNAISELTFRGSTQQLRIVSLLEARSFQPALLQGPRPWPSAGDDGLGVYRFEADPDPSVTQFAAELARRAGHEPLQFLDLLAHTLCSTGDQLLRLSGAPQPSAATLASRQGSCRDFTALFLAACRSLGIASRFCSGYQAPLDALDISRELHAWPEVFLPGAGWRGWDPTQGRRVADGHLPLCAAASPRATLPVEGGYYFQGPSVTSTLDFDLRISADHGA